MPIFKVNVSVTYEVDYEIEAADESDAEDKAENKAWEDAPGYAQYLDCDVKEIEELPEEFVDTLTIPLPFPGDNPKGGEA
jgi:hypothetical protein